MSAEESLQKKIRFRGSSSHVIDSKGRIIIPSRFRTILKQTEGNGLMITKFDNALFAYPYERWEEIETRISSRAKQSDAMRRFKRIFIGTAYDCSIDKQDRILVPQVLRKYASIVKEIELVGVLDHFEIWSAENWDAENQALEDDLSCEDLRNDIADLGL